MSFNYKSLLPTPAQIKAEFPLTPECVELKAARDKEVADVITGKSEKFLVIIGPCSADREDAVCEYMSRLAKVNEQVKDKLVIVPRVYTRDDHKFILYLLIDLRKAAHILTYSILAVRRTRSDNYKELFALSCDDICDFFISCRF